MKMRYRLLATAVIHPTEPMRWSLLFSYVFYGFARLVYQQRFDCTRQMLVCYENIRIPRKNEEPYVYVLELVLDYKMSL